MLWLRLILTVKITELINLIVLLLVFLTNCLPAIKTILPFQLAISVCGASHKCKLGPDKFNRTITLHFAPGGPEEVGLLRKIVRISFLMLRAGSLPLVARP